ncbi:hypothetical protein ACQPXS_45475 [Streptomyces sp. CA-142005]|uniref:hypothetical protein n=1 Tax=Streptomyces sp. CA-142005 TaxID=3240052 RepID=UPI003D8B8A70
MTPTTERGDVTEGEDFTMATAQEPIDHGGPGPDQPAAPARCEPDGTAARQPPDCRARDERASRDGPACPRGTTTSTPHPPPAGRLTSGTLPSAA